MLHCGLSAKKQNNGNFPILASDTPIRCLDFVKSVILSVLSLSPTFNEMPFMSDNANIDEDIIVSVIKDYLLLLKEAIESLIEKY